MTRRSASGPRPARPGAALVGILAAGVALTAVSGAALGGQGADQVANTAATASAAGQPGLAWATATAATPIAAQASGPGPTAVPAASSTPGWVASAAWRMQRAWHVPVLTYHLIATAREAGDALPGLVVAPDVFRAQMATARAAGWRTITAATLGRDMELGTEPAERTFVLTIDDGHEDGYTNAFSILGSVGFVATYFVPTARVGHPGYLTAGQLQEMTAGGMEIANHTVHHLPLADEPQPVATAEIVDAQQFLAQVLGNPPATLAYPYGNEDPAVIDDVDRAGFLLAFTTAGGCRETVAQRLMIPRLRVRPALSPAGLLAMLDRCANLPALG